MLGKSKKIEFDAREPINKRTKDIFEHPEKYSFIHNFKVHCKFSALQFTANKIDISINSSAFALPSMQEVTSQFSSRMMIVSKPHLRTPHRGLPTFRITNVEYKESIATALRASELVDD
jgi:hypothetical protein